MPKRRKPKPTAGVRSWVAVSAQMRSSGGAMGGGKKTKNRRDRADTKRALKRGEEQ